LGNFFHKVYLGEINLHGFLRFLKIVRISLCKLIDIG
jgi:hypothetical protein